ncbi:hypothetical protein LXL04_000926 [Taraxacum kok-saghyz]
MKTRTREQTWSLDQFKWHFCNSETTGPPPAPTGPPPAPTTGPPSDHHRCTTCTHRHIGPLMHHRRTTAGPPQSEIRMTLIYDADAEAEADEEMLTLMNREQLELMVKSSMEKDAAAQLPEDADGEDEAERAVELGSALAANAEMESELRKLKVQTEQWRKAAAMVLGDGGGKFVEQSESFDIHGEKSNSPNSEDTEEESSNKKNNGMLKKIRGLLKKGQKQFETSGK